LRIFDRLADRAYAISNDQNFAGPKKGSGVHLEKARGVKDYGCGYWRRRLATQTDRAT